MAAANAERSTFDQEMLKSVTQKKNLRQKKIQKKDHRNRTIFLCKELVMVMQNRMIKLYANVEKGIQEIQQDEKLQTSDPGFWHEGREGGRRCPKQQCWI